MEEARIAVWVSPEFESSLTHKELAIYIGVTVATLQQRLRDMGADHYLTYFPGRIPAKLRRMGNRRVTKILKSTIADIKVERLCSRDLNARTCVQFITKLITRSLEDLRKYNCCSSRKFLMNADGMLAYYLELIPGINLETYLLKAKSLVRTVDSQRL